MPVLINRQDTWSGNPRVWMTNLPHREWIYRAGFDQGRHIIGYEVQKVLALVDWFRTLDGSRPIGVAGYGEGGLIAFMAAALDPRISACLVSGYFDEREQLYQEPLYRNVFGQLTEFGDAEIAGLIAPRPLIIEHARARKSRDRRERCRAGSTQRRRAGSHSFAGNRAARDAAALDFFPEEGPTRPRIQMVAAETPGDPGSEPALVGLLRALGGGEASLSRPARRSAMRGDHLTRGPGWSGSFGSWSNTRSWCCGAQRDAGRLLEQGQTHQCRGMERACP